MCAALIESSLMGHHPVLLIHPTSSLLTSLLLVLRLRHVIVGQLECFSKQILAKIRKWLIYSDSLLLMYMNQEDSRL